MNTSMSVLKCPLLSLSYRECVALFVINSPSYRRDPHKVHEKCERAPFHLVVVAAVACVAHVVVVGSVAAAA